MQAHMRGTLLGIEHSMFSLARVAGPATGVMLLNTYGVSTLSMACAAVFVCATAAWKMLADTA